MERETLIADEGMIYTDGNTYGSVIYLANGMNKDNFYQITKAEYEEKFNDSEDNQELI